MFIREQDYLAPLFFLWVFDFGMRVLEVHIPSLVLYVQLLKWCFYNKKFLWLNNQRGETIKYEQLLAIYTYSIIIYFFFLNYKTF